MTASPRKLNTYEVRGDVALITLNGSKARETGAIAIVDACDVERVIEAASWHLLDSGGYASGYVRSDRRPRSLHRFILVPADALHVDHINGDKLDNRRANLRACTNAENQRNRGSRGVVSAFKGAHRNERGRWRAEIKSGGSRLHLGIYDTDREAALAYDIAARALHREFARLNLPNVAPPPELASAVNARIERRLAQTGGHSG